MWYDTAASAAGEALCCTTLLHVWLAAGSLLITCVHMSTCMHGAQDHSVFKRRLDSSGSPLHEEGEAHKVRRKLRADMIGTAQAAAALHLIMHPADRGHVEEVSWPQLAQPAGHAPCSACCRWGQRRTIG